MNNNIENIYQNLKNQMIRNGSNIDDAEIRKHAWIIRDRINEQVGVPSTSVSVGSGGGKKSTPTPPQTNGIDEAYIISWLDIENDIWYISVYNYGTGTLSDPINTNLVNSGNTEWSSNGGWRTTQNSGFAYLYNNSNTSKYKVFFIDVNGALISVHDFNGINDFLYNDNNISFVAITDSGSSVFHFTGDKVNKYDFELSSNDIRISYSNGNYQTSKNNSIIIQAPVGVNYYVSTSNGELVNVSEYLSSSAYTLGLNNDFASAIKNDYSQINVINDNGTFKNSYDLTTLDDLQNILQSISYGDNSVYYDIDGNFNRTFVVYDGDINEFTSLQIPYYGLSPSITYTTDVAYTNPSWYDRVSSYGKTLVIITHQQISNDSLSSVSDNVSVRWLPKGHTEFLLADLTELGEIKLINGSIEYTNRTFTTGENPYIMFADGTGYIKIGFLTNSGMSITNTNILYENCTNVISHNIKDKAFAVYDINNDTRIWQIYGNNTLLEETETSIYWNYGFSSKYANRYGTLAVIDSGTPSNSFYYTSETGLVVGTLPNGLVYNEIGSGDRSIISLPDQLIFAFPDNMNSDVIGFHLLNENGLSDLVLFPDHNETYNFNNCKVGKDIIVIAVTSYVTNYNRLFVYDKNTLELLDDFDTQGTADYSFFSDRVIYIQNVDTNVVSITFSGAKGKRTVVLNTSNYTYDANDVIAND